jgi:glycosyltransferase involved in cell wall biosynthesis
MGEMMKDTIIVVVPAYNEEKMIVNALRDLLDHEYRIIVVDDCSTDGTYRKVRDFIRENGLEDRIALLKHAINRGQGAALQTGTDLALKESAEIIVHFDGDGQFLAGEIEESIQPLINEGIEIVLGSRFLETRQDQAAEKRMPKLKMHVILPVSRIINYFLTGLRLTDAHCGFRAMTRRAAQMIDITQDRMSHNTQIVAQIRKRKLKYREVPITVIYHEFGQDIGGGFKILRELFVERLIR